MKKSTEPNITIVLGTRPEIIKLAPVIRECEARNLKYSLIHTGQHYSRDLDAIFFEQLGLQEPDYNLEIGSKSHGRQTGEMIIGIEEILVEEEPDVVLVQGDTNSVLAGAIATSKLEIEIGHVEAGLRSFDRSMPEETNRILTDHTADYLFAPTKEAADLLTNEGLPQESIFVTGNTIVDAVLDHQDLAETRSEILAELNLEADSYALVTAHRAENVDDPSRFQDLLTGVATVGIEFGLDVVYPIHPRAENQIREHDIDVPNVIQLIEPQDYLDFLRLEEAAGLILTDSGGVQEEACILGTPCVTLRDNTERPETIDVGANVLAGVNPDDIESSAAMMLNTSHKWENPFGNGTSAKQIIDVIISQNREEPR